MNNPTHLRRASVGTSQRGPADNVYAVFEKSDGSPAKKIKPDPFPEVQWVSIVNGTREKGDIEDRAAKFLIEQNLLLINADFPAFGDMTNKFLTEFVMQKYHVHVAVRRELSLKMGPRK